MESNTPLWLLLLSAVGCGSIITGLLQWHFNFKFDAKKRRYSERKEAYIGMLEAWKLQEEAPSPNEHNYNVGHWVLRAKLVADNDVYQKILRWEETTPGTEERIKATELVKAAFRKDLRSF